MAFMKPILQTYGGGGVQAPARARDAHQASLAQNAALGLDNFARLLQDSRKDGLAQTKPASADENTRGLPLYRNMAQASQQERVTVDAVNTESAAGKGTHEAESGDMFRPTKSQELYMRNMQQIQALERLKSQLGEAGSDSITQLQNMLIQKSAGLKIPALHLEFSRPTGEDAAILQLKTTSHKGGFAEAEKRKTPGTHETSGAEKLLSLAASAVEGAASSSKAVAEVSLGLLSSIFESGKDGIAAVGYDRAGGTSYGLYQISSKAGTMNQFIKFLDEKAPDLAQKLKGAGPANTGGCQGKMPDIWRGIAEAEPERFEALQHNFIFQQHFTPAMGRLNEQTGLGQEYLSPLLQEVLFSTAVQHGPGGASRIMARAIESVGAEKLNSKDPAVAKAAEEKLVRQIYAIRSRQFDSSTPEVQAAVKSRLKDEMGMVISMLKENYSA